MKIANRPQFTEAEVKAIAREYYGLETDQITIFESERDQNSLVKCSKGNFVLKISHPAEDPEVLGFQNEILKHSQRPVKPCRRLNTASEELIRDITKNF